MPRTGNTTAENRLSWLMPAGNPPVRSIGLAHQGIMRLSSPAVAMAARPVRASLTAIQRVRVTLWFQGQPESAGLQLAGHQRRAPEDADEAGRDQEDPGAEEVQGGVNGRSEEHTSELQS